MLTLIEQRLPVSLSLTTGAMILWLAIGLSAGVASALREGRFTDRAVTFAALLAFGAPVFVSGLLLLMLFCGFLQWLDFPVYVPVTEDPRAVGAEPAAALARPWRSRSRRCTRG